MITFDVPVITGKITWINACKWINAWINAMQHLCLVTSGSFLKETDQGHTKKSESYWKEFCPEIFRKERTKIEERNQTSSSQEEGRCNALIPCLGAEAKDALAGGVEVLFVSQEGSQQKKAAQNLCGRLVEVCMKFSFAS